MESGNPIELLRLLYQFNPQLSNLRVIFVLDIVFNGNPLPDYLSETEVKRRMNALSTQKARLRQEGLKIPDGRKSNVT